MSRLFMNLTTNLQHYPEWTAYLKDRQPKTLIVWGRNDPLILPAAAEFVKQAVPAADLRYFRHRPLCARRERRRDRRGDYRDVLPVGARKSWMDMVQARRAESKRTNLQQPISTLFPVSRCVRGASCGPECQFAPLRRFCLKSEVVSSKTW